MENFQTRTKSDIYLIKDRDRSDFPGYTPYLVEDDIFNRFKEVHDIDPEDISKHKVYDNTGDSGLNNKLDFNHSKTGNDLDIPGSELDDEQEAKGSEDEENNSYSLGGG